MTTATKSVRRSTTMFAPYRRACPRSVSYAEGIVKRMTGSPPTCQESPYEAHP